MLVSTSLNRWSLSTPSRTLSMCWIGGWPKMVRNSPWLFSRFSMSTSSMPRRLCIPWYASVASSTLRTGIFLGLPSRIAAMLLAYPSARFSVVLQSQRLLRAALASPKAEGPVSLPWLLVSASWCPFFSHPSSPQFHLGPLAAPWFWYG